MNFHHHPSAPHITAYTGEHPGVFVSSSKELTEAIAHAAKSALMEGDRGAWTRACKVRVDPPDMDSSKYTVAVEIPERSRSIEFGLLNNIAAYQRHLIDALEPLQLTIDTEETPSFFGECWLAWTIIPAESAAARAMHVAFLADYKTLGKAAADPQDQGHAADILANTEEPGIPNILGEHLLLCESLAESARRLTEWQDEKTPVHEDWPWLTTGIEDDGTETAPDGTKFHRTTIRQQAESQAKALERAARQARLLSFLAPLPES